MMVAPHNGTRLVHVLIEGQVQGVGFRFWCERAAVDLDLTGWVRNCRDGRVEALFHGADGAVEDMLQRCHEGPRWADVTNVIVNDRDEAGLLDLKQGFHVRPTS